MVLSKTAIKNKEESDSKTNDALCDSIKGLIIRFTFFFENSTKQSKKKVVKQSKKSKKAMLSNSNQMKLKQTDCCNRMTLMLSTLNQCSKIYFDHIFDNDNAAQVEDVSWLYNFYDTMMDIILNFHKIVKWNNDSDFKFVQLLSYDIINNTEDFGSKSPKSNKNNDKNDKHKNNADDHNTENMAKLQSIKKNKKYKGFILHLKCLILFLINLLDYLCQNLDKNKQGIEMFLNLLLYSNKQDVVYFYENFKFIILFLFETKFDAKVTNDLINIIIDFTMLLIKQEKQKYGKKTKNSVILAFAQQIMCIPGLYHINPKVFISYDMSKSPSVGSVGSGNSGKSSGRKYRLAPLWDECGLLNLIINDLKHNKGAAMLSMKDKYNEIPFSAWFISNVACLIQCIDSMEKSQFVSGQCQ